MTTSRLRKTRNAVPLRGAMIGVLWVMDHLPSCPEEWCNAEVLHVDQGTDQSEHAVLATGVLRYLPDHGYEAQVHIVEFMPGHLLRCISDDSGVGKDGDTSNEDNLNPQLAWRYSSITEPELVGSDEDEWGEWNVERSKKRRAGGSADNVMKRDIIQLRSRYSDIAIQMELLRQKVEEHSAVLNKLNTSPLQEMERYVKRVVSRLRVRLVIRLQSAMRLLYNPSPRGHWKPRSADAGPADVTDANIVDGIYHGCFRIRSDCDLDEFEALARATASMLKVGETVFFYPSFSETQCPSLGSTTFSIVFASFLDLCTALDIGSLHDRIEMLRKCGSSSGTTLLRVIGAYVFNEDEEKGPCYINVGGSGRYCHTLHSSTSQGSCPEKQCNHVNVPNCPMLMRSSREWLHADERFRHPLRYDVRTACLGDDPAKDPDTAQLKLIHIVWRRSPEANGRLWSAQMSQDKFVHGTVEVHVPYVQARGDALCSEIAGLLTEDVIGSVVSKQNIA